MDIQIKKASPVDASIISKIYADSWKVAYRGMVPDKYLDELKEDFWVSSFQRWLEDKTMEAGIIYENDIPVGAVGYGLGRDKGYEDWGEIASIYVSPDFVGKGYGQRLMDYVLQEFKNKNLKNCYLWVLNENTNAQRFYKAYGFEATTETLTVEIQGKQLVDFRYRRKL